MTDKVKLYAVKNDEGEWSDDDGLFYPAKKNGVGFIFTMFSDRDEATGWAERNTNGGHVVTLIEEPEKVVLTNEQAEIVEDARLSDIPATYISAHTYEDNGEEILLMNAWNNGYTVKKESRYMVYVPGTNKKFLYNKRGDSSTRAAKLETPIVPSPVTSYQTAYGQYKPLYWFTDAEITKFGLQDCDKVEVTDNGMGC